jgi:hypothetical protein
MDLGHSGLSPVRLFAKSALFIVTTLRRRNSINACNQLRNRPHTPNVLSRSVSVFQTDQASRSQDASRRAVQFLPVKRISLSANVDRESKKANQLSPLLWTAGQMLGFVASRVIQFLKEGLYVSILAGCSLGCACSTLPDAVAIVARLANLESESVFIQLRPMNQTAKSRLAS